MLDMKSILDSHERANLEVKLCKGGLPKSIWPTYSSFANSFGGTIVLGIQEDKASGRFIPVGVDNPQQLLSDISSTLNNQQKISANILNSNQLYSLEYEGKTFIVLEVPRADRKDKPVYVGQDFFKGTYRRNHEGDYHCSKEEVKSMLRDQSDDPQDSLVLSNRLISELNIDSIHSYRMLFKNVKGNHVWTRLSDEDFLFKLGAIGRSPDDGKLHPTLGGLVFFGDYQAITAELPGYFLDYREHGTNDTRWTDRICSGDGNWSGNIFDFYYKIFDKMTADVKRPFQLDDRMLRIDDTEVHKALRECLANALIHADYHGPRGIVIDKGFRTLTISNPGTFRVSLEEAISGGISDTRNPRIFNMFSLINVGERSGTGLCNVYNLWKENGFKKPQLAETLNPDRVTLTLELYGEASERNTESEAVPVVVNGKTIYLNGTPVTYKGNLLTYKGIPLTLIGSQVTFNGQPYINDANLDGNLSGSDGNPSSSEGNPSGFDGNPSSFDGNPSGFDGNPSGSDGNSSDINNRELAVLEALKSAPDLTIPLLKSMLGVSESTIERALRSLKRKGLIRREGSTRGRWIVL